LDGDIRWVTPPGVLYGCENKRVGEKGICKSMKTKGQQIGLAEEVNGVRTEGGAGTAEIPWSAGVGLRFHGKV